MRKSQLSRVSSGSVVQEDYLYIDDSAPVRYVELDVAEMSTEDHEDLHGSGQMGIHHKMAGMQERPGAERHVPLNFGQMEKGGTGTSSIEGTGLGQSASDEVRGYK